MSKSIHITIRDFRGLTKYELEEQLKDKDSDCNLWAKKRGIKKNIKKNRKNENPLEL